MQSTTLAAGADNASGTHRPGHYIRGLRAARDRLRVEDHLAVARPPARAGQPRGRRLASPRAARNRTAGIAGGDRAALRTAQAAAAVEYEELAFHLEDSVSFRAFARLPLAWSPKKSVLHRTISAIRPETWEAVNRALLASAKQDKLESGAMVRIDSTVTAALMHEPSDSALLWDAVRIMTRLLRQAAALPGAPALQWRDRRRYLELIAATRATLAALQEAGERLADLAGIAAERWRAQLCHYLPLIERILAQSQRRVLDDQAVPAGEKLVSLFEPHADIIVKGARDVPPRQVAADGGYASRDNLTAAKARGVKDVAFHKKRGLAVEDMVKSRWVYRKLRNFRAGIEAGISCLKRAYGLARCTWRGLVRFKAYIWSAVVAHNLVLLARLKPA